MPRATSKTTQTRATPYDVAEHLRTPEEMAAYLDAWLEAAPDDAAGIAKDAGLSRASLNRALSADGNPSFATVLKVARALGVKLHAEAAQWAGLTGRKARWAIESGCLTRPAGS